MSEREFYAGAWGMELRANTTRDGFVDDGNIAWPERIVEARRQWPEAPVEDFEKVGKRLWRDRASGVEYKEEGGAPMCAVGTDSTRFVSCFLVVGGRLIFLARSHVEQGTFVRHGEVVARELPVQAAARVIH